MDALGATPPAARPPSGEGRPPEPSAAEQTRLRQVAQDFEAILLTQMIRQMRDATPEKGIFRSGGGLRTYQTLLDDELGRALARGGGVGLASTLTRDLARLLSSTKPPSSPSADLPISSVGGTRHDPGGPR